MEITPDIIEKGFESMPPELRKATREVDVSKTLHEIAQKYHLHMDVVGSVVSEAWYVILGLKKAETFDTEIGKSVIIPQEQFSAMLTEINEHVFAKIREKVLEIRQKQKEEEELDEYLESTKTQEEILHESGIDIQPEPAKSRPSDNFVPDKVQAQEDMISKIETPPSLSSIKLNSPHGLQPTERVHSVEKPPLPNGTPPPPPRSSDPYKEPIQ
ncbi:MAG: hypothetical protein KBC42_03270 [Candidatus Pacebacteria bacterium]|nr:hypothetical protein [Candidatus Paceibacterota bacterium]MBP9780917.1 hypothetical protein [Candidatus Paceibacterota bacterium]